MNHNRETIVSARDNMWAVTLFLLGLILQVIFLVMIMSGSNVSNESEAIGILTGLLLQSAGFLFAIFW